MTLDGHPADWSRPDEIQLTSVGVDVGSTTSHFLLSRLVLRRLGKGLSSRYVTASREVLYRSPIWFTPFADGDRIDVGSLEGLIDDEYVRAGVTPAEIDTGAVVLTGEAARKENARAISESLASRSGEFVCAAAGHHLEAALAARGSGAVEVSRSTPGDVLAVDIGGGTTKLALLEGGELVATSAINIGGRLVAYDQERRVCRLDGAARVVAGTLGLELHEGMRLPASVEEAMVSTMADALMSALVGASHELVDALMLTPFLPRVPTRCTLVFSGGVGDLLRGHSDIETGDLGPALARAIRDRLTDHEQRLTTAGTDAEGIRATVVGASQFTVQVSGDTIFAGRPGLLPVRNLQVLAVQVPHDVSREEVRDAVRRSADLLDNLHDETGVAVVIGWEGEPSYPSLRELATGMRDGLDAVSVSGPVVIALARDLGKAIGRLLATELQWERDFVCIDGLELTEYDYVDVGSVVEPQGVVPVVIKSLVFDRLDVVPDPS